MGKKVFSYLLDRAHLRMIFLDHTFGKNHSLTFLSIMHIDPPQNLFVSYWAALFISMSKCKLALCLLVVAKTIVNFSHIVHINLCICLTPLTMWRNHLGFLVQNVYVYWKRCNGSTTLNMKKPCMWQEIWDDLFLLACLNKYILWMMEIFLRLKVFLLQESFPWQPKYTDQFYATKFLKVTHAAILTMQPQPLDMQSTHQSCSCICNPLSWLKPYRLADKIYTDSMCLTTMTVRSLMTLFMFCVNIAVETNCSGNDQFISSY